MSNWNTEAIESYLGYRVIREDGLIQEIMYEGESSLGKPTQIFAYMGIPENRNTQLPGMVCAHGGGGKAFREWVDMWVKRGYAAISMDLSGRDSSGKRLSNGGPEQDDDTKFNTTTEWQETWTYHSVAAVMRANSILRSLTFIDSQRIGITGISWGGYVTCIAAGVDKRFACAIPVYGCGFLQNNSAEDWMKIFAKMNDEERQIWHDNCDPSVYLAHAKMPMLFVSGTNDFAYPLDSLEMSCALPKNVNRCVRNEMGHSHQYGWAPDEIAIFANQYLLNGLALPNIKQCIKVDGNLVQSQYDGPLTASVGYLLYTTSRGPWVERKWYKESATVDNKNVEGRLPDGVTAYFLAIEDERGAYVSSPCIEVEITKTGKELYD